MRRVLIAIVVLVVWLLGCSSSESVKQSENSTSRDTSTVQPPSSPPDYVRSAPDTVKPVPPAENPNTIKPNLSFIGAQVESVEVFDEFRYRLHIFVGTSINEPGVANLIEPSSRIAVEPMYKMDSNGKIDMNDETNKRLLKLRSKKASEIFLGKVSLVLGQGFRIVWVESY